MVVYRRGRLSAPFRQAVLDRRRCAAEPVLKDQHAAAMPSGRTFVGWGIGCSINAPAVVMRPILLAFNSVNHRAPSGPVVMKEGWAVGVGIVNSVNAPAVVMRPILLPLPSVNHWALGLLVGINMVFGGVALVAIASHARSAARAP
jgi:hypothetical protein